MADNTKLTPKGTINSALNWYTTKIRKVTDIAGLKSSDKYSMMNRVDPRNTGQMFLYYYEAKHKDTLPYWDRFPLVFPIKFYNNGFLGINLHYLPTVTRRKFMDVLFERATAVGKTDQHLKVTYDILNTTAKLSAFKPCVKRYLYSHVASQFYQVKPEEWYNALLMPTERFATKTKGSISKVKVWEDSIRSMGY